VGLFLLYDVAVIVITWSRGYRLATLAPVLVGVVVIAGLLSQYYSERGRQGISKLAAIIALLALAAMFPVGVLLLLQVRPRGLMLASIAVAAILSITILLITAVRIRRQGPSIPRHRAPAT
jgi:ABC-type multidrug transport system permease subunit